MLLSRASSSKEEVGGLPPPPGVSVDLSRPDTNLYKYNVACVVLCYIVVGSIVLARIYTKVFINRKVVLEDRKDSPPSHLQIPGKLIGGRYLHNCMGWSSIPLLISSNNNFQLLAIPQCAIALACE